jgi:predicted dehydrogenase
MNNIRFAIIGLGNRGWSLMRNAVMPIDGVEIVGVCDLYPDRCERARAYVAEKTGKVPVVNTDYRAMLEEVKPDAALVATGWGAHTEVAVFCMEKGIPAAVEVGGAYSPEECWALVDTYEKTKTPVMLMENCCFNKSELLVTSMVRDGLFGEIVHCSGAYAHDLRAEILASEENRHYRLQYYKEHNCENYPTHELGPIAKLLGINRGNRMVSLVSVASKSRGFAEYINSHKDTINPNRIGEIYKQGDVVNTLITCENGETISLRLDASLPRTYNRELTVRGTKGMYEMGNNMVFLDGMKEYFDTMKGYLAYQDNARAYEDKYLPAAWKEMTAEGLKSGHGGMDGVEFRAFFSSLREGVDMPIDVYDMAAWMCITYLSEKSIAEGGMPQPIPDFTRGAYKKRPLRDVFDLSVH